MSERKVTDHWEAFREDYALAVARYTQVSRLPNLAFSALTKVIEDPLADQPGQPASSDYDVGDYVLSYSLYEEN